MSAGLNINVSLFVSSTCALWAAGGFSDMTLSERACFGSGSWHTKPAKTERSQIGLYSSHLVLYKLFIQTFCILHQILNICATHFFFFMGGHGDNKLKKSKRVHDAFFCQNSFTWWCYDFLSNRSPLCKPKMTFHIFKMNSMFKLW